MESRVKVAGHPVHPMLVVFPLGLLATAVVFDIIYLISDNPRWALAAYYMIGAGIIGGVAAAIFGLLDWLGIPAGTRAKRIGAWHGLGNTAVVALFLLSWVLRRESPAELPTGAIVAGLAAVMISLIAAWLGAEMVYRLSVGVDSGAHLDSPSSLSELPAGAGLSTSKASAAPKQVDRRTSESGA